ncbi:MAG: GPR endopeptidase [Ruminococcaceae bacterium]|nr:GPR endopeptidase [Oscillospiraceae bacterium]
MAIRTDLAMEARELTQSAEKTTKLPGVKATSKQKKGVQVTHVQIVSEQGEQALGKPRGQYVTLEFEAVRRKERDAVSRAARILAEQMKELTGLQEGKSVLLACLGNPAVTPDAVGPLVARQLLVTRHLVRQLPEHFGTLRQVSVMEPGVLGTTGVESAELISAAVHKVCPDAVIAVDALASRSLERLFTTVQLTDVGITPGSGVGNSRKALSSETLGVPVYALGVPTVVDASTLVEELTGQQADGVRGMIVTGKDVDASLQEVSRLVAVGLNLFLHPSLDEKEIAWLTGG